MVKVNRDDRVACWRGFYQATLELAYVAKKSAKFNAKERKSAMAIELVARLEGGLSAIMIDEFSRQYNALGSPGDFGYDTDEGRALQAVYDWWFSLTFSARSSNVSIDSDAQTS